MPSSLKSSSAHRLPAVDAFLRKDLRGIKKAAESSDPGLSSHAHIQSLKLFLEMENEAEGYLRYPEFRGWLQKALEQHPSDIELLALTLSIAMQFSLFETQLDHVDRFQAHLQQIKTSRLAPDICVFILCSEWRRYHRKATFSKQLEILKEASKLSGLAGNPFWIWVKINRLESALLNRNVSLAEEELKELAVYRNREWWGFGSYELMQAWFLVRSGRFEEMTSLFNSRSLDNISSRDIWSTIYLHGLIRVGDLEKAEHLLEKICACKVPINPAVALFHKHLTTLDYEVGGTDLELARKRMNPAREHAQNALQCVAEVRPGSIYTEYPLLKIELASGSTRAARVLLQRLYPDEFNIDWAFLHMLEGDLAKAIQHVDVSLETRPPEAIRSYFLHAPKLSNGDLLKLFASVYQKNSPASRPEKRKTPRELIKASVESHVLVGESHSMQQVHEKVAAFAQHDTPVLITGETGSGKEVVAQLLHQKSNRSSEPFLSINCGALSETLIESELFGHIKGSFTGAESSREGLFVAAGTGTIFLDEVSSMSSRLQSSLLRVLEQQEVRPVGSNKTIKVRARVIAATNEPLDTLVAEKKFRMDLYFRLARFHIPINPLRDRREDIPLLARYFIKLFYRQMDVVIGDDLIEALKRHDWPGNVRELKNEIERIALLAGDRPLLDASLFNRHPAPSVFRTEDNPATSSIKEPMEEDNFEWQDPRHKVRRLFEKYERLTRAEIVKLVGCSPNTATRYLKNLEEEKFIRRVNTSANLRTSYFILEPRT
jgi:DNA-binding NtrC family response regulator